jgi:HEAT repeat protein
MLIRVKSTLIFAVLILICLPLSVQGLADDVDLLIATLNTGNSSARVAAAAALGEMNDTRSIDPLIRAMEDEEFDVEYQAAKALEKMGKPVVEPLILALKDNNFNIRWEAADILGAIGDHSAADPLFEAIKDENSVVRTVSAKSLAKLGDLRAVDPLIELLKSDSAWDRADAADALGDLNDSRAVEPLISALEDEKGFVQESAAKALGKIRDVTAVEPLIQAIKHNSDYAVQEKARDALIDIGEPATDALIVALNDSNKWVRYHAAYSLAYSNDARAIGPLEYALSDEDKDVRDTALDSVLRLEEAVDSKVELVDHSEYNTTENLAANINETTIENETKNVNWKTHTNETLYENETSSENETLAGNETQDYEESGNESDLREYWSYENHEFGFSLRFPGDWKDQDADSNSAGMIVGFLAPGEDVDRPSCFVVVQYEDLPQPYTVSQYANASLQSLKGDHPDINIIEDREVTISDLPARELVYKVDQDEYQVLQRIVVKDQRAFVITFNSPSGRYPQFEGDAREMIDSFGFP